MKIYPAPCFKVGGCLGIFSFFMFIKNFICFGPKFIVSNVVFMFLKSQLLHFFHCFFRRHLSLPQ